MIFDRSAKAPLVMLSTKGGMDIEEVADEDPDAIARLHVDPLLGFQDFHGRRLAFEAGVDARRRPAGRRDARQALRRVHRRGGDAGRGQPDDRHPASASVKALDAKVTLDDNALFRHPENAELRDLRTEDPQERMAKERGLTYVKLDGDIGILGNGAGLVMSTLDVVAQAGGKPANFLDAGGGSKAEAITSAVEVILSNPKVKAVLFNIFGGITRGDEVAKGLIEAFDQINPQVPFVVRLDGTNDAGGPAPAGRGQPSQRVHRVDDGRRGPQGRRAGGGAMSILVDTDTKLCVSGITGREGTFHSLRNRDYGTQVVAGVTPGKGGQDVEGIPVFNTFHDAVERTGANTAMIFVPPRFAADSILEAEDAGIELIIAITEGIPAHDELRVYNTIKKNGASRLVGPNCPGILSPGKANVGIIPAAFFKEGNVGVVSRSGTLTYQIGNVLAQSGFGNSTIVGIGGDPVPGTDFIDVIGLFQEDPETELIVMCGEIGGDAEEQAAEFIAENVTKPVVAYIAGFTAPPGKTMGHAGAIVSGSRGTAAAKARRSRPRASGSDGPRPRSPSWPCRCSAPRPTERSCASASSWGLPSCMRRHERYARALPMSELSHEAPDLETRLAEIDRRLREIQADLVPERDPRPSRPPDAVAPPPGVKPNHRTTADPEPPHRRRSPLPPSSSDPVLGRGTP